MPINRQSSVIKRQKHVRYNGVVNLLYLNADPDTGTIRLLYFCNAVRANQVPSKLGKFGSGCSKKKQFRRLPNSKTLHTAWYLIFSLFNICTGIQSTVPVIFSTFFIHGFSRTTGTGICQYRYRKKLVTSTRTLY